MTRVAITGVGVVSAIGNTAETFWTSLVAGASGIRPLSAERCGNLKFRNGAEAQDFRWEDHFDAKRVDTLDRFSQFAIVAAREAVRNAAIEWTDELRESTLVAMGTGIGGQSSQDQGFWDVYKLGKSRVHPFTIPRTMANAGASQISIDLGITGPSFTLSTACASAAHAIGLAFQMVRGGQVELAICGGSEAPFSFGILKAWEAMRVVSADTCRPFCKDRSGMILGEGAGVLVLESMDRALGRGANIYAEIAGFGMSSDASHITQPAVDGPARAMRLALRNAAIDASAIGYINAHGTGTEVNDVTEARAIHSVFGGHASQIAVSSTKSMHGHALGAAAALEAVATVLALDRCVLPPTANFTERDPQCDLDVIANQARARQVEYALSNSFAFGGMNAVLAFRRMR